MANSHSLRRHNTQLADAGKDAGAAEPRAYAISEREKVGDYLLNALHRYGESKARFFTSFGFQKEVRETTTSGEKVSDFTLAPQQ